ncbi:unnamed protein product [Calypogeia fissa]
MSISKLLNRLDQQAERVSAGCENIQASLLSCQDPVQGDNPPFPTPECCTTLKELSVGCLCKALAETDVPKDINNEARCLHVAIEMQGCDPSWLRLCRHPKIWSNRGHPRNLRGAAPGM